MKNKVLEVKNLHFSYGEIHAIKGISFDVYEGEVVTLLGANGAGKTTTLQSISGLIKGIKTGEIYFMGENISGVKPHLIAGKGLAQCLEGRLIFPQLTVMENLLMGAYLRKNRREFEEDLEYVFNLFPRLLERKSQHGGTLSGGEQQMLAVGRALMQKPRLLMMDEPSLGLAPLIIEEIFKAIKKINSDGIPILLVEQNSNVALSVTDRGYVMETGEIRFTDTAKNLLGNDEIKKAYLGVE
jgi:branched-chain amino acid transport system ATP-binding protein